MANISVTNGFPVSQAPNSGSYGYSQPAPRCHQHRNGLSALQKNSLSLCQENKELIDLTIELVKIYLQPLVNKAFQKIEEFVRQGILLWKPQEMQKETCVWEVWMSSEQKLEMEKIKVSLEGMPGGFPEPGE